MLVTFGNGELSVVSESKQMGVVLSSERKQSQIIYADRIAVGRNALLMLGGWEVTMCQ